MCARPPPPAAPGAAVSDDAAEAFAIDAGRDLFFSGMDAALAISILGEPLGSLSAPDDRYIAAERLKFFPSAASARALMRFVDAFADLPAGAALPVEELAARRKAVESLGRHRGLHLPGEVAPFLERHVSDPDALTAEAAAWAVSQLPAPPASALLAVELALARPCAPHRALLQALTAAGARAAAPAVRALLEAEPCALDAAARSAAAAALAVLAGDERALGDVPALLRSPALNERRAAASDLAAARFRPALHAVAQAPLSLVLRARAARAVLRERLDGSAARALDRLLWDHPADIDLLGRVREGARQRDVQRNVRALYRNDALDAYVACRTLCEDAGPGGGAAGAGQLVLQSHVERPYFDYFGAYHVFKTLGWMRFAPAFDALADAARTLPPRFFNHRAAAITALANLADPRAVELIREVAREDGTLWHIRYACLISAERLGDPSVRELLRDDKDWLVRARAQLELGFDYLQSGF